MTAPAAALSPSARTRAALAAANWRREPSRRYLPRRARPRASNGALADGALAVSTAAPI